MGESWQKHCGYRSYGMATLGVEQLAMFTNRIVLSCGTKAGRQTRTKECSEVGRHFSRGGKLDRRQSTHCSQYLMIPFFGPWST